MKRRILITALGSSFLILVLPLVAQQFQFSSLSTTQEFRLGVQAFHNGRHNESILSFSRVVAEERANQLARVWLGRAYFAAGFEEAALQEWRLANQIATPIEPLAYTIEAIEARRSGRDLLRTPPDYILAVEIEGRPSRRELLFSRPAGLYPRSDGSLLVTSFASNETLLLNVNGRPLHRYRSRQLPFDRPYSILEGDDGSIFVSEFGSDRVVRFSPQGRRIARFNRAGPHGLLAGPQYMTTDQEGNIYVSDWGNRRIVKFNANGTFLLTMGEARGSFDGLQDPTGVIVAQNTLYVADSGRSMLVHFDTAGNFLEEIPLADIAGIESLSIYDESHLLMVSEGAISLYNTQLQSLRKIIDLPQGRVTSAARDVNANIVAADFDRNQLFFFTPLDDLFSGLLVRTERIDSESYPQILLSLSISDRFERPVVGLESSNFTIIEDGQELNAHTILAADHTVSEVDIVLIIPATQTLQNRADDILTVVEEIQGVQEDSGSIGVIEVTDQAVLSAPLGSSDVQVRQALQLRGLATPDWDIDSALQLATNELLRGYAKRAVIVIRDDATPSQAFTNLSFSTMARRLKNNHIHLYVISTSPPPPADPLFQLTEESDGKWLTFAQPESFSSIISDMRRQQDGRYTLQYTSNAPNEFGRRYIEIEVIAQLLQRSGSDRSGYFSN